MWSQAFVNLTTTFYFYEKELLIMYAVPYKLNDSYTTYVVLDWYEPRHNNYYSLLDKKPLKWEVGAYVKHPFHGEGEICYIDNHKLSVIFYNSRQFVRRTPIKVDFEFSLKPSEISSLRLCYKNSKK